MTRKREKLEVSYEYVTGKDSERHLLQAVDILFQGIVIDWEVIEAKRRKRKQP